MGKGVIDEYFEVEEFIELFEKEGFVLKETRLKLEGVRREFSFDYEGMNNMLYFSIMHSKIFLGIGTKRESERIKISKIIHEVVKELEKRPCTKFLQLINENWYSLGADVIANVDKYEYLADLTNYKRIKKDIIEMFKNVPFTEQPVGIRSMYIYGAEATNLVRALMVLGYIYKPTEENTKQTKIFFKAEYKNRDLFCDKLNELGYSINYVY